MSHKIQSYSLENKATYHLSDQVTGHKLKEEHDKHVDYIDNVPVFFYNLDCVKREVDTDCHVHHHRVAKTYKRYSETNLHIKYGGKNVTVVLIVLIYYLKGSNNHRRKLEMLYMSRLVGKPTMWFPNRSDTNWPVQAQISARSLKFWS